MNNTPALRSVWLAIIVLTAVIVGTAGGVLSWLGGMNPANAVLAGGGIFAAAVTLLLSLLRFATDHERGSDSA